MGVDVWNRVKEEAVAPIDSDDDIKPTIRPQQNKCPDPGKRGSKGKSHKSHTPKKDSKSAPPPNSFQAVMTKLNEVPIRKSGKRRKILAPSETPSAESSAIGGSANEVSTLSEIEKPTEENIDTMLRQAKNASKIKTKAGRKH